MSLGAGILLVVIGAILTFALDVQVDWINLVMVGYILMAAGLVGIILGIVLIARRRSSSVTVRSGTDPATGERVDRTERNSSPPPPAI